MQKIIDSTLSEAREAGCDTVQLKYDGMPVQFAVAKGILTTLDATGRAVCESTPGFDPLINCTLIGTYVPLQGKRYVFDCWCVQDGDIVTDLRDEPYRSRYVAAKIQCALLGAFVTLVTNHSILKAPALWSTLPHNVGVKGLVFRNSKENARGVVRVARFYPEVPRELT